MTSPISSTVRLLLPSLCLAALAACGDDSSDSDFSLATTGEAAAPSAPIALAGDWMVYLASEGFTGPTGTNFNNNGTDIDTSDQVAFAVDLRARTETNLGVATLGAVIVGSQIYLVVDEAQDSKDWNISGGATDVVLLHWSSAAGVVTFVDTLDLAPGERPRAIGGRLYYAGAVIPAPPDATNLNYVTEAAPTTPVNVLNQTAAGQLVVHVLGTDEGLLFLFADENDVAANLNGDADATDTHVLALLDGTNASAALKIVGLALADSAAPLAARSLGTSDWLVAFLVDEAAQGTNLNDQTLFAQPLLPENCPVSDADALDTVLHYLDFSDFFGGTGQPVNTGLAGHDRVLIVDGSPSDFVATISAETEASCNLNAGVGNTDSDTNDDVARWVKVATPIAPAREREDLLALASATPGGSFGLNVLGARLVAVIDEAADGVNHDGKATNHDLVAWLDPAATNPTWQFSHQSSSNNAFGTGVFDSDGDSEPFAGTSWMAAESVDGRLGLVFLEEVPGTNPNVGSLNTNLDCNLVVKDNDKVDGLPVWADFEGSVLDFDGMGYSVDEGNAGIEIAVGFAFFRVSEADDNRDYNADGQKDDVVLFRNPLTTCGPIAMATSSLVPGQAITTDRATAAAFLSSETQAGVDFNEDGDTTDLVVRYFRF